MKKFKIGITKIIAYLILGISCIFTENINAQVNITTVITPPYPSSVFDYANRAKTNVTLMSTTAGYVVYPQVVISSSNGITIRSINRASLYTSVSLTQFMPTMLSGEQLSQLFERDNLTITGMNSDQLRDYREN